MIILGLGGNIGDRQAQLETAVKKLTGVVRNICCSRVLESPALMPEGAPKEWDSPFLNMAVRGETNLSPPALLTAVKTIERELGRVPGGRWCPRAIDIDILAMDGIVFESPELTIPHRELLNRSFALLPLADVAPDWRWPQAGEYFQKTAAEIAKIKGCKLPDTGIKIHG
ncbi:MAG: 2-amino-4-hydroxy-6-hydroxymethyldihydropteridine diphosphokinase [Pseudomonadota bacterium]|nr:2-amino-4-hydroxy-6-hydroxymethyldihydropteridine diphosphokinase [Pseudomonadota bacterium]